MKIRRKKLRNPKTKKKDSNKHRIAIIIIVSLLLLVILFTKQNINNSIIFLYSDECSICSQIEPEIREITSKAGMKFYKLRYDEPGTTPGLIFIHHNEVLISSYKDAESFKKQICGFTKIKKACRLAGEVWQ